MTAPKLDRRPIRLLDPGCVERIAAGEVIERPASALKELIENSLDAGAQHIRIRIRRGGLEEITIEDDGAGIPVRELPLAVERHATSKIAGSGDLAAIASFGFRGEALASMASVSRFSIRSRFAGEEVGGRLEVVGGRLERREPFARHVGTTITVSDLFFNLPARRAFLKSETSERKACVGAVTALALAHPEVSFRLESDDKVSLDLAAARDLETRAHSVFGASTAEHLRHFDGEEQGIKVEGLASLPTYSRGNRTGQFIYINRRPIFDKGIAHALSAAYREVLPSGRFPLVVMFLELPAARVDVNVHPTKAEVRLRDAGLVHALVRHSLHDGLQLRHEPTETSRGENATIARDGGRGTERTPEIEALERLGEAAAESFLHGPTEGHDKPYGPRWSASKPSPELFADVPSDVAGFQPQGAPVDPGLGADLDISGQLFWQLHNTFILTQIRGALVIVDQHNSHERILYNEGKTALEDQAVASQQLLFPTTMDLDPQELGTYELHRGDLERLGFLTEPFGGATVMVRGIPSDIRNWNDGALLRDILADLDETGRAGVDPREAILASYSCHGAIKAGEKLTLPEMQSLMDRLFATELPYSCPHGRPTLIRIGLGELERRFGRR